MLLSATHIGLSPVGPGVQQQPLHLNQSSSKQQQRTATRVLTNQKVF